MKDKAMHVNDSRMDFQLLDGNQSINILNKRIYAGSKLRNNVKLMK